MELCELEDDLLPFNEKRPIIMPQRHNVTKLIIQHYHQREGHMGSRQVLISIRNSFWIIHGPSELRKQIKGCMECKKRFAKPGEQIMANLPDVRVIPK